MKKNIKKYWLFALFLLPITLFAQEGLDPENGGIGSTDYERNGTSSFMFLKLQTEARTAALAGIKTVFSRSDASSALTNPASMTDEKNIGASFSYVNYIADINYGTVSLVKNFGNLGAFGISLIYLDYGEMYETSYEDFVVAGENLKIINDNLGTFSGGDMAIGLSYARNATDRFQIGGTVKYIQETLVDTRDISTSTWSIDIGTVYYTGLKTLRIAMLGSNFGPDAEFKGYEQRVGSFPDQARLPMVFSLGAAMDVMEGVDSPHFLTVGAEFIHPNDGPEKVHFATEYVYNEMLSLRGGYRFKYDEEGITFGAGVNLDYAGMKLKVNYAYVDFGRLQNTQMFSVIFGI